MSGLPADLSFAELSPHELCGQPSSCDGDNVQNDSRIPNMTLLAETRFTRPLVARLRSGDRICAAGTAVLRACLSLPLLLLSACGESNAPPAVPALQVTVAQPVR